MMPTRVKEETVDIPAGIAQLSSSATRIDGLFRRGLIVVEDPDYTDNETCKILDRIGDCIAKRSGKRRDLIERADLHFAALALNHSLAADNIDIVFRDVALRSCIESVLTALGRMDRIKIVSSHEFLEKI